MSFQNEINSFIETKKTDENKDVKGYEKDLNIFKNYLWSIQVNEDTWKDFLRGIKIVRITESIDYYINNYKIARQTTVNRYVSAIIEFLRYLFEKKTVENDDISKEIATKTFLNTINNYIKEHPDLKSKEDITPLTDEQISYLIKECDNILDTEIQEVCKNENSFNKYQSAIIIKLMILTGIRYDVVKKIKAPKEFCGYIKINNFEIKLPRKLKKQFKKLLSIRAKIIRMNNFNSPYLFLQYNEKKLPDITNNLSVLINSLIGRRDVTGIIKYGIIDMILKGINSSIIKKLTGVNNDIYDYCQDSVNEMKINDVNKYLNNKIKKLEIFKLL